MKTVSFSRYGPPEVLQVTELKKPVPRDGEVLIKIHATTAHVGDTIIRRGKHPDSTFFTVMLRLIWGVTGPRRPILGMELAGVVEETGVAVTRFQRGDRVFASTFSAKFGAYAEYKCLPETGIIAPMPDNMSFEEAAALPGGAQTALKHMRKASIERGQEVLIHGASGSVGSYAVQIAKHFGASVTGVCSTSNVEWVAELGADQVIDYTKEDFAGGGKTFDVVFDAVAKAPTSKCRSVLKEGGRFLSVFGSVGPEKAEDLVFLKDLAEAGKLQTFIDRRFTLDEIVEAHRYVDRGHKKGNVAITVASA
ncbi:MAG: NAD(P)-dependent alcohol dehydrogenase [Planctomycetota bacterium]|jgi:NADPH:quinone reductase-like Zn-dependent oxidoreductase